MNRFCDLAALRRKILLRMRSKFRNGVFIGQTIGTLRSQFSGFRIHGNHSLARIQIGVGLLTEICWLSTLGVLHENFGTIQLLRTQGTSTTRSNSGLGGGFGGGLGSNFCFLCRKSSSLLLSKLAGLRTFTNAFIVEEPI